jgi:hypothetical protein
MGKGDREVRSVREGCFYRRAIVAMLPTIFCRRREAHLAASRSAQTARNLDLSTKGMATSWVPYVRL